MAISTRTTSRFRHTTTPRSWSAPWGSTAKAASAVEKRNSHRPGLRLGPGGDRETSDLSDLELEVAFPRRPRNQHSHGDPGEHAEKDEQRPGAEGSIDKHAPDQAGGQAQGVLQAES